MYLPIYLKIFIKYVGADPTVYKNMSQLIFHVLRPPFPKIPWIHCL